MIIDKQDGRRFSGTFSSPRGSEPVIGVVSRSGTIFIVDDDGYTIATMLAPNRVELCYLMQSPPRASHRVRSLRSNHSPRA